MSTIGPFFLLTDVSTSAKWQTACSYALIHRSHAVAAAMAQQPVAAVSAVQLAASANSDLARLVQQALRWSATGAELPSLLPSSPDRSPTDHPPHMDINEYLWEAADDQSTITRKVAHPPPPLTTQPQPRPPPQPPPSLSPLSPRQGRARGPRSPGSELRSSLYGRRLKDPSAEMPQAAAAAATATATASRAAGPAPCSAASASSDAAAVRGESRDAGLAADPLAANCVAAAEGSTGAERGSSAAAAAAPADAVSSAPAALSPPPSPSLFYHPRLSSTSGAGLDWGPFEATAAEWASAAAGAPSTSAQAPGRGMDATSVAADGSRREPCRVVQDEVDQQRHQGQVQEQESGADHSAHALASGSGSVSISGSGSASVSRLAPASEAIQDGIPPQAEGRSTQVSVQQCTRPSRGGRQEGVLEQRDRTHGGRQGRRRAGETRRQRQPTKQPEQQQPQQPAAAGFDFDLQREGTARLCSPSACADERGCAPTTTPLAQDAVSRQELLPSSLTTAAACGEQQPSKPSAESGSGDPGVGQKPPAGAGDTAPSPWLSAPPVSSSDADVPHPSLYGSAAAGARTSEAAALPSPPRDLRSTPQALDPDVPERPPDSQLGGARLGPLVAHTCDASCQTVADDADLAACVGAATAPLEAPGMAMSLSSPSPPPPQPPAPAPAPAASLFDVLRTLPPDIVWRNLLSRLGPREWSALRQLAREWDLQVRHEWSDSLQLVLGAECVRELRRLVAAGSLMSVGARHSAATRLYLSHRRIERTIFPNTVTLGSSGLLEMSPVVVDDAPPLPEVLDMTLGSFRTRLQRLHLSCEAAAVSELELEMMSLMAPELEELVLRFDCCERPAPLLSALGGLSRLQRLGLQLNNSKLNFDPVPERMVGSLAALTGLRALSLELTATSLPLPARALERLTSLRLAVVFRGYSAGQQSEQLRGLVAQLGHLTALRALTVPDGYRGSDGDLLRAASFVLPSLTALHMPRLSATRPDLEALARLPLLQHVTLGSLDIAPDEDYEGLLPYEALALYDSRGDGSVAWARPTGVSLDPFAQPSNSVSRSPGSSASYGTLAPRNAAGGGGGGSSAADVRHSAEQPLSPSTAAGPPSSDGLRAAAPTGIVCEGGVEPAAGGSGPGFGRGGDGGDVPCSASGSGSGVLSGMTSWSHLVLCAEQRMEALVAAGPLPAGLRELRVEQLRWPQGSRADALTKRGVLTLRALCADLARLPSLTVDLSLEALPGAATATFNADDGLLPEETPAQGLAGRSGGGGGGARSSSGWSCVCVREVVMTACGALARVGGLRRLRWAGLLPLLAHLGPRAMAHTLARLGQVSELEVVAGLSGAHPCSSPVFLLHLARGLEAMPRLRRLGLLSSAPHSDALVQGLPGLLVALRRPLLVEAGFVGHADAAALRDLLATRAAPGVAAAGCPPVAAGEKAGAAAGGSQGEQNVEVAEGGTGAPAASVWAHLGSVSVLAWEEAAASSTSSSTASAVPIGRERQCCAGGWVEGSGLWWVESAEG